MKNLWLCERSELCEIQGRNPDDKRGLKPTRSLQKGQWNAFLKHKDTARTVLLSLPLCHFIVIPGIGEIRIVHMPLKLRNRFGDHISPCLGSQTCTPYQQDIFL